MKIHGLQKLTLLDVPGYTACTVFLGGCNFRCPFCHNASLVLSPQSLPTMEEAQLLSFLASRQGLLDAVCITGGEPTLYQDLPMLIQKIRALGFLVKLDTNGTNPTLLQALLTQKLVDFVAMDIKNTPEKYPLTVGLADFDVAPVLQSIAVLKRSSITYEFRTTVVRELHTVEDIATIAALIAPAERYFLQSYKDGESILSPGLSAHSSDTLTKMCQAARQYIPQAALRGV